MSRLPVARLPPLLARLRNSAQSQPTACTARPGRLHPFPRARIRFSLSLETPDNSTVVQSSSSSAVSQQREIVPLLSCCLVHIEALPPPCDFGLTSSLGESFHRRHRTRASPQASVPSTKTCTYPRAGSGVPPPPAQFRLSLLLLVLFPSVATVLCSLSRHYCSSGMHLCRSCGINIGPLRPLRPPTQRAHRLFGLGMAIPSRSSSVVRIHHRSRLRDL